MARALFSISALLIFAFSSASEAGNRMKRFAQSAGVSQTDKDIIVATHNEFRGQVQPPATDLAALVWSDELAGMAQEWANKCIKSHGGRAPPNLGMSVGQNMGTGHTSWRAVISHWFSEKKRYRYGVDPNTYGGFTGLGHYTQIVMNTTYLVGCGFKKCNWRTMYFCNYAAGQMANQIMFPYTSGPSCSACPNNCKDNLCQCGDKMCKHGGQLDLRTCTCKCPEIWQGPTCTEFKCPPQDSWMCEKGMFTENKCQQFTDVRDYCPFMCGLCHKSRGWGL